jgi:2-dehydropantoate 2-reductase
MPAGRINLIKINRYIRVYSFLTMDKKRIAILGIGAVGGYFGGRLAKRYSGSDEAEIIFIARGANENVIRQNGIRIIMPTEEIIAFPDLISNDPEKIGKIDVLICSVKSYHLEESLIPLKRCIHPETLILPLLNGVDAKERIISIFPDATALDGCVYIVSRLIEPGVIRETGNIHSLYFGSSSAPAASMNALLQLLTNAGIEAHLPENIEKVIWEKFFFISCIASLTSYLDKTIGAILEEDASVKILNGLFTEIKAITNAKGIELPEDIIEKTMLKLKRLPYETTSSMHTDFQKGGQTESASLTEYVVKIGGELNIPTPVFSKIAAAFSEKTITKS